jgi:hypothetical protein
MADRVHVFGGGPRLLAHRSRISLGYTRRIAACLTGDLDVSVEAAMAASYDLALGGDDSLVGCHMTFMLNHSSDEREFVERVILACDLLRQAKRTAH